MKNNPLLIYIFITALTFLYSCSNPLDADNIEKLGFEEEYYFSYENKYKVYRSLNFISIRPAADVDLEELNDLVQEFNLQPVTMFYHRPYERINESLFRHNRPIVLKLSENVPVDYFYSGHNSESDKSFADHPLIHFSLPVYSRDSEKGSWFYVTDEIVIGTKANEEVPESIIENYELEFISKSSTTNRFRYRLTNFGLGSPFYFAKKIFEDGDFHYVVPNSFSYISLR